MNHEEIIKNFYTSFANGDYLGMVKHYHEDIIFQDPAFGELRGEKAGKMWEMLLSRKDSGLKVSFSNVQADDESGSADWKAVYAYGPQKRQVINQVQARFVFKNGKIVEHIDSFDIWKWSRQALGPIGSLMGWTPFMKRKIQSMANHRLDGFIHKQLAKP